jgi:hypothetical protein
MFVINNDLTPDSFLLGTKFYYSRFNKFFDSLAISNIHHSDINNFALRPTSTNLTFSLKRDKETFEFLLSSVHKEVLFFRFENKITPISFEKLIKDYIEPSKLEAVLKLFTILKIANVNPIFELKSYLEYRIAIEQEINIRKKIFITSFNLVTSYQKDSLKVTFFNGVEEFIIHFEPFSFNRIKFNNRLCFLVVSSRFLEEFHLEDPINHFIQNVSMNVLERMVHHHFTNSKEYKMRALYDDDFIYLWNLRLEY